MKLEVNGHVVEIDKNDLVFEMIEKHTGLDRPFAERILRMGNPIKHPEFQVRLIPEKKAP